MNSSALLGSPELQNFWKGVGSLVNDNGRIDLLACGLGSNETGKLLLSQLESMVGRNFAASDDPTGNPQYGGDWVLESDGIDVGPVYFNQVNLVQFNGVLENTIPIAQNFSVNGYENRPVSIQDWKMNDTEEGNNVVPSSVTITSLPGHGALKLNDISVTLGQKINANDFSHVSFSPDSNWAGTTSFGYKVSDSNGGASTDSALVTVIVKNPLALVKDIRMGSSSSSPFYLTNVGGTLFFMATDSGDYYDLWKTDGTEAGTSIVTNHIYPVSGFIYSDSYLSIGSKFYFRAYDSNHGYELWSSDGTALGTMMLKDINGGSGDSDPRMMTNVNGTLFFMAHDTSHGYELWKSDGTESGTVIVKDICEGTGNSSPSYLTNVNGTLFFAAADNSHGSELWKSDGTGPGTTMVKDVSPGIYHGCSEIINVNGTVFFRGGDEASGEELWKSDGTPNGTVRVMDIYPGQNHGIGSNARFTNVGGILYFVADDGIHGRELWSSDGTPNGTKMVMEINPGLYNGPDRLTEIGGTLYFVADDGIHGRELWSSDGTPNGTKMVKDIWTGSASGQIDRLTESNGKLYFQANDGIHGTALWQSDGTAAGTFMVADIDIDSVNSSNSPFVHVNGSLYFSASDSHGSELWGYNYDQAPMGLTLSANLVNENQAPGTVVGTLTTADSDYGDTFTYSLVSGDGSTDNGSFTIEGGTLKTNVSFDYEIKNTYSIRVQAIDSDGVSFQEAFTINVGNVNEAPIFSMSHGAGSLDPSFSGDGTVTTDFSGSSHWINSMAIQGDGKIVAAGAAYNESNYDFALVRYNSNGSLDATFDADGKLTTDFSGLSDYACSVAIQGDGKIVAAGVTSIGSNYGVALTRYDSAGTLDPSFSDDGMLTTTIDGADDVRVGSVAIQADGKILVAGSVRSDGYYDFALLRYNSNGTIDTTFSGDGLLTTDLSGSDEYANSVVVQADGKIVVAGSVSYYNAYFIDTVDFALARYNSDGSLDTSFGVDGKLITDITGAQDYAMSVAIQPDGKIVVTGGADDAFGLVRYNSDGSLDTSFGTDGTLTTANRVTGAAQSLSIQPDGKIVVAGISTPHMLSSVTDFAIARYNSNGTLDTSFSGDGKLTTDISGSRDDARSVAIQADGKIVVAGNTLSGSNEDFSLVRYDASHLEYTENAGALAIDNAITLTDVDNANMASATIRITDNSGNYLPEDTLDIVHGYSLTDGVTATWDGEHGELTLSGSATTTVYESILEHVTYTNSSEDPSTTPRTVTWTVTDDGMVNSVPQASTITVTAVNDAPTASGPTSTTTLNEDGTVSITVHGTDVDNPALSDMSFTITSDVHNGTLVAADTVKDSAGHYSKVYTYTPNTNFNGSDPFEFTFTTKSETSSATDTTSAVSVPITVNAVNDLPEASGPTSTTTLNEDGSTSITVHGTDVDNPALSDVSFTVSSDVHNGKLVAGDTVKDRPGHYSKVYTYTPNANFNGTDSFEFTFSTKSETSNSTDTTSAVSVPITVNSVNDTPTATGPTSTTTLNEDGTVSITVHGTDVDNPALSDVSFAITSDVFHGTLVAGDMVKDSAGHYSKVYTYTPDANFNGSDPFEFTFTTKSETSSATDTTSGVSVPITVTSVNDAPTAVTDSYTTAEDTPLVVGTETGLLANDADVEGSAMTASLVTGPANGTLALNTNGSFTYTPNLNYFGADSFTYKANDGSADGNTATVNLTVTPINDRPVLSLSHGAGTLDPTFGSDGKVTTSIGTYDDLPFGESPVSANAVAIQPDGKIVVAGTASNGDFTDFALARYDSDGTLDTSFGVDGKVTTDMGWYDRAQSVAVQPDGKIIVAGIGGQNGNFALARYNADGSLDDSFGVDGKLITGTSEPSNYGGAKSVVIQSDGKIVVTGIGYDGTRLGRNLPGFEIERYNSDGSPDANFDGDGRVTTNFWTSDVNEAYYSGSAYAQAIAIQADGKIVVAGQVQLTSSSVFALARYNVDGSLDTSFDGDGKLTTGIGRFNSAYSIAMQLDGKIVAAGYTAEGPYKDLALCRYNSDGSLDNTFDGDGNLTNGFGGLYSIEYSAAIQPDGKIVVSGSTYAGSLDFALTRFNRDGSVDSSFNRYGQATTDFAGYHDYAYSLAIQADGKIVVAGRASDDGINYDFALARYTTSDMEYTENAGAQVIDNIITVTDTDSATMASARLQITGNYQSGQDVLSIAPEYLPVDVTSSWDGVTGTLTLSGTTTKANYDSMLEHVTYTNSSDDPNTNPRTVTWTVTDGAADSVGQASTIAVTALNDAPTATGPNSSTTLNEDGSTSITVHGTDVDNPGLADVSFAVTSNVAHGTLVAGDTVKDSAGHYSKVYTYTPEANFNGGDSFEFTFSTKSETLSSTDTTSAVSVPISVTAVNDAPAASGPVATTTLNEDGSTSITVHGTDADNPALSDVSFTITSNVHNGTLVTGDTVKDSAGHYSKVYTYTPNANFNGTDSFEFTFSTKSETSSSTDTTSAVSVPITVTSENDAPVNSIPVPQSTNEDTALIFNSTNHNAISISDVDAGTAPVKVELAASQGYLTLAAGKTGTLTFSVGDGVEDSSMTFTGSVAAINDALNGMTFTPKPNYNGTDAGVWIVTSDLGQSGSGLVQTDIDLATITVNAVNDRPSVQFQISNVTVNEDAPSTVIDLTSAFHDIEDGDNLTYSVVNNTNPGLFSSVTVDGSSHTLTLGYAVNKNGAATVTVQAMDSAGLVVQQEFTVTVNAVNDAPVNSLPAPQTTTENTALRFSAANHNAISISDVDAGTAPVKVDLVAPHGVLTLADGKTGSLTFSVGDGNQDACMVFTGSIADINAALDGLTFTPDPNYRGPADMWIVTNDQGHSGSGVARIDTDRLAITVNAPNHSPVAQSPISNVTVNEDAPATVIDLASAFHDTENGDSLTYSVVDNTNSGLFNAITVDGQAHTLTLGYAANRNGAATLTVQATDSDGAVVAQQFTVTVNPVNDLPSPLSFSVNGLEDNVVSIQGWKMNDIEDGNYVKPSSVTISSLPGHGDLKLNNATVILHQVISASDFDDVSYVPDDNWFGTTTFEYKATDSQGGKSTSSASVNINVAPVNDPPTALAFTSNGTEDSTLTISGWKMNDTGDGNNVSPSSVIITSLPDHGTLKVNNSAVIQNQVIDSADFDHVTFVPVANWNGTSSFTYKAIDSHDGTSLQAATATIKLASVNDQPTATNLIQTVTYMQGAKLVNLTDIVVADTDTDEIITATLNLSNPAAGALSIMSGNGESYYAATGKWTITDTLTKVNSALASVVFIPDIGNNSNATIVLDIVDGLEDNTKPLLGLIQVDQIPQKPADVKLTASDGTDSDLFGWSVSTSGEYAIVGAPCDDIVRVTYSDTPPFLSYSVSFRDAGSAHIFKLGADGAWSEKQRIDAPGGFPKDNFFGWSVSVSNDYAIIGAPGAGSAYIFKLGQDGLWTENQRVQASDRATDDTFGYSVAISGEYAIVGAVDDDTSQGGKEAGSAYIYKLGSDGLWTETQHIFASDGAAYDYFGNSLSISGKYAIVGAYKDSLRHFEPSELPPGVIGEGDCTGSAYVYMLRDDGLWTEAQHIWASDRSPSDEFGRSVSISGEYAIVGASLDNNAGGTYSGSAYIYALGSDSNWVQTAHIFASDAATADYFGGSVSISGDHAIVGAKGHNTSGGAGAGSAYIYKLDTNGKWTETDHIYASDGASWDSFGFAVSLSGHNTVIGAIGDNTSGGTDAGSAYIFHLNDSGLTNSEPYDIPSDHVYAGNLSDGYWNIASTDNGIVKWYKYDQNNHIGQWWWDGGESQFRYYESAGQWEKFDSQTRSWLPFGILHEFGSQAEAGKCLFDGAAHSLDSVATYKYMDGYGYWQVGGKVDFLYDYTTGKWLTNDGDNNFVDTGIDDISYVKDGYFLASDYIYWDADGFESPVPITATQHHSEYSPDVKNRLWNGLEDNYDAKWFIFTPGDDMKWSGGDLNVVLVDNNDSFRIVEQYTKSDVVVMEYNLEVGTGGFQQLVDRLDLLTLTYDEKINNLAVVTHGVEDDLIITDHWGMYLGDLIDSSNYGSFRATFEQLGNYMAPDGQIQLYQCGVGAEKQMLDDIASWTHSNIFANVNLQWYWCLGQVSPGPDDLMYLHIWNYNRRDVFLGGAGRQIGDEYYFIKPDDNFVDYYFEYRSNTSLDHYNMLFDFADPGYRQANMVYWWNNDWGRPLGGDEGWVINQDSGAGPSVIPLASQLGSTLQMDAHSGSASTLIIDGSQANALHLLVISSGINSSDDLALAAADDVLTVTYDPTTDSPDDILSKIETVLGTSKADSIAFATHDQGPGQFYLTQNYSVSSNTLTNSVELQNFWKGVGSLVNDNGRIDLLACGLVSNQTGNTLLSQLESLTDRNFAASDDATGNPQYGGDWILESDGVNIAPVYFSEFGISQFTGLLQNSAPTGIVIGGTSIVEASSAATKIGSLITRDPDVGDTHTYTLVNGDQYFELDHGNELWKKDGVVFDYNTPQNSFGIQITSTDQGGLSTGATNFTINVTSAHEPSSAPQLITAMGSGAEDSIVNLGSHVLITNGASDELLTVTLTAGKGFSTLHADAAGTATVTANDSTTLTIQGFVADVNDTLQSLTGTLIHDWNTVEAGQAGSVSVQVSDALGNDEGSSSATLNLFINPVNDIPVVGSHISNVTVNEGASPTVVDLTSAFHDLEDDNNLTYSIVNNTNPGLFNSTLVDNVSHSLMLNYAANQHGVATITVQAMDSNGATVQQQFTVSVNTGNDAPVAENQIADVMVAKNAPATIINLASAFQDGEDGDNLTYSIVNNTNADLFSSISMDPLAHTLTLNYTDVQIGVSTLTVQAVDSEGAIAEQQFTVLVHTANGAPLSLQLSGDHSIVENAGSNAAVGTFSATDPDSDSVTYSLVGVNGQPYSGPFDVINGNHLVAKSSFDFETQAHSYSVTVKATDEHGLSGSPETFTINVTDVNESATVAHLNQERVYADGASMVSIDPIVIADPDAGSSIAVTLTLSNTGSGSLTATSGHGESFSGTTGVWTVTGAISDVNAALAHVTFIPSSDNHSGASIAVDIHDAAGGSDHQTGQIALKAAHLAADINLGPEYANGSGFTQVGDYVYFISPDQDGSVSLMRYNLTNSTLSEINMPAVSGYYYYSGIPMTAVGTNLFVAWPDAGGTGNELWMVDHDGASHLINTNPIGADNPTYMTAAGDKLFLSAIGSNGANDLWMVDSAGNSSRINTNPNGSDSADRMAVVGSNLFVKALGVGGFSELFMVNSAGVAADVNTNSNGPDNPQTMVVAGNNLFVSAYDEYGDLELWLVDSDGVATDVDTNFLGPDSPTSMVAFGSSLFVSALDEQNSRELSIIEVSDGLPYQYYVDTNTNGSDDAGAITVVGSNVFMIAKDDAGIERLWKMDCATGESAIINTDAWGSMAIEGMKGVGQNLFVRALDSSSRPELWMVDSSGTMTHEDLNPSGADDPLYTTAVGNSLFVVAGNPSSPNSELWMVGPDGTKTHLDTNPFGSDSPTGLRQIGDKLFVNAVDGLDMTDVWIIDTSGHKDRIVSAEAPRGNGYPSNLTLWNDSLIFNASDGDSTAMWRYSPSTGAAKVDMGGISLQNPYGFTAVGSNLFFSATDSNGSTDLWMMNSQNNVIRVDTNPNGSDNPSMMTAVGDKLFVAASNSSRMNELWMVNSSGVASNLNINSSGSDNPSMLKAVGDKLFASASDASYSYELWMVDTTGAKTKIDIVPGASDNALDLASVGDKLFLSAVDTNGRQELWMVDTLGNKQSININPSGSDSPNSLTAAGGKLFLSASDSSGSTELWMVDTSGNATRINTNPNGSDLNSYYTSMVPVDDNLLVAAKDSGDNFALWLVDSAGAKTKLETAQSGSGYSFFTTGNVAFVCAYSGMGSPEFWLVDSTGAKTILDINAEGQEQIGYGGVVKGENLYFGAYDPTHGQELWVYDLSGDQPPFELSLSHTSVDHAAAPGTEVGSISAVDPEHTAITYSLVTGPGDNDNHHFVISGDKLVVKDDLGSNTQSSYSIRLAAIDAHGLSVEKTFIVTAIEVNHPPTANNNTVSTAEDNRYVFSSGDFNYADVDGDTLQKVKITQLESAGALKLNGVDVTLNQEITISDVDSGYLTFDSATNSNGTGYATFKFRVSDGLAYSDADSTMTIDVTRVNDLPEASGPTSTTTLNEDGSTSITVHGTDVDNPALTDVRFAITSDVSHGTLVAGDTVKDSDGHYSKVYTYTPNANFNGSDTFAFTFSTKSETSSATNSTSAVSVPITVNAVNDAPTSGNGIVNAIEDTRYVFSSGNFNFADVDGDTLQKVKITKLETAGALKLNGVDVTLDQEISIANINSGHLTFDPASKAYGTGYSSFQFKVSDGAQYSTSSYTETINVTARSVLGLSHGAGALDPTFGSNGKVITDFNGNDGIANSLAIQADGKIVVAGQSFNYDNYTYDFTIARYNTDGTMDKTFGSEGMVTTDFNWNDDSAHSVTIQADGKIVVAGSSLNYDDDTSDFAIVRYNTDGTMDKTFGSEGMVTTDFNWNDDSANSVTIQPDGKIVVAGSSLNYDDYTYDFAIARYNNNGSLDTTFSGDGMVTTDFSGNDGIANSVAIQDDGKIVVAGQLYNYDDYTYDFAIARYNNNGNLDTTFRSNGKVTTDFNGNDDKANSVAIQDDGKIVVAGSSNQDFAIARYNTNGSLDTTFSGDGKLSTDFSGDYDTANSLAIQADGKIVAVGSSNEDFAIARYNTDGTLDTSFDDDGELTTDIGSADNAYSVAIQADGKILAAGYTENGSGFHFALARYDASHIDYTENAGAQIIDNAVSLTDIDSANMASAKIQITGNYHSAEDTLGINPRYSLPSGVTANWNGVTGTLTLEGVATTANYASILEHVTYTNSSDSPNTSPRSVTWTVNDGAADSVGQVSTITVTGVNDPPVLMDGTVTVAEGAKYVFVNTDFNFSDVDTGDTLQKVKITKLEKAGALKLNGVDVAPNQEISIADINAGNLTFDPEANASGNGHANFKFKVSDGTTYSDSAGTITINVTPAKRPPVVDTPVNHVVNNPVFTPITGPAQSFTATLVDAPLSTAASNLFSSGSNLGLSTATSMTVDIGHTISAETNTATQPLVMETKTLQPTSEPAAVQTAKIAAAATEQAASNEQHVAEQTVHEKQVVADKAAENQKVIEQQIEKQQAVEQQKVLEQQQADQVKPEIKADTKNSSLENTVEKNGSNHAAVLNGAQTQTVLTAIQNTLIVGNSPIVAQVVDLNGAGTQTGPNPVHTNPKASFTQYLNETAKASTAGPN